MTIMAGQAPNVTRLPARELSRLVMAATRQPGGAPGANPAECPERASQQEGRRRQAVKACRGMAVTR